MNKISAYCLIGLCALAILATLDHALSLGGGALLAEICRTILDDDSGATAMPPMSMEVKPIPIIALSLCFTGAAIFALIREQKRTAEGRSTPDVQERAAMLSAMFVIARSQGQIRRDDVGNIFNIVTEHDVEPELVDLFMDRFQARGKESKPMRLEPIETSIGRRRTLAAALLMGCVGKPPSTEILMLIEQIARDIGATKDDVRAARLALTEWQSDCVPLEGVSPIALLRNRSLTLKPA